MHGGRLYEVTLLPMMVADAHAVCDGHGGVALDRRVTQGRGTMPGSAVVGYNLMTMLSTAVVCGDYEAAAYFHGTISDQIPVLSRSMAPQQVEAHDVVLERVRGVLAEERFETEVRGARLALTPARRGRREAVAYVARCRGSPRCRP